MAGSESAPISPDGKRPAPARGDGGKLHLALAVLDLSGGGVQRMVLTLAQALLDRGHRVDLLLCRRPIVEYPIPDGARLFLGTVDKDASPETPPSPLPIPVALPCRNHLYRGEPLHYPGGPPTVRSWFAIARRVRPDVWPTLYRFLRRYERMRSLQSVARYLEAQRPDCVLANGASGKIHCLLARHLIPRPPPVVPVVHSVMDNRRKMHHKLYPHLLPAGARVVAVSHAAADSVRAVVPEVANRIATIHNPARLDAIMARAAEPPLHPWLEDDGAPVILAVGRLEPVKHFPLLLHAFARVAGLRPCRLLILGEGPVRPRLEALVRQLRLTGCVAMPGWVENPWAIMARATMFVLSSRWEGLPNVLIEAFACGCPVVSTDAGGAREILDGDRYGELVPVEDEARLALAILHTLDGETRADPEQRRQKREERVQRARMFLPERAAEQYLNLLDEVLPGRKSGSP